MSSASPRIVLVRHGRSAHIHSGEWVDAAGVERWRAACDAAGLATDDHPPAGILAEGARAALVLASDLPRAAASAERIVPGRVVSTSALLREVPLEIPRRLRARLPLAAWEALIHARWGWRILRGRDVSPEAARQCEAAAEWLVSLVHERSPILVVTHGVFRRLLARRLQSMGWRFDGRAGGYSHWSAWALCRTEPALAHEPERVLVAQQRAPAAARSVS